MKKRMTALTAAAAIIIALPLISAATGPDRVEALRDGKEKVEGYCSLCHTLERVLAKRQDRQGWDETLKRMVTHGGPFNSAFRESVAGYLTAKSSFETNCSSCHSNLRVLSDKSLASDWKETVGRMGKHIGDLSKKGTQSRMLSEQEIADIAAFLTVVIPRD